MYDYLIVGAGLSGCVLAERLASQLKKRVLIVERRNHIAGNAFDYYDEKGLLVHRYGPHVFHTNSEKVWQYLSNFTSWRPYEHRVLAVVDGKGVPIPFNLNSLYLVFPEWKAKKFEELLVAAFGYGSKLSVLELRESASGRLRELADFIYDRIFFGYTRKQWGVSPEDLDSSVTARVPIFVGRDNRYFHDTFQGVPLHGYSNMFRQMVEDHRIEILLDTDFTSTTTDFRFAQIIYTGAIDRFFDYMFGELPYRSLRFDFKSFDCERFQQVAQVNYPNGEEYTRTTEFKHLTGQQAGTTSVAFEYPTAYSTGVNEPYYPIPNRESAEVFRKYSKEARKLKGSVHFVGRLADYRYYNMDQVVARALSLFEKEICGKNE